MNNSNAKNIKTTSNKIFLFRQDEAEVLGMNGALVLNQIRYWTDPQRTKNFKEGRYWVYNSLQDWKAEFFSISERTLRRVFHQLENLGVLIAKKFNAWRRDQRKWHTINFEKLNELLQSVNQKPSQQRRKIQPDSSVEKRSKIDLKEAFIEPQNSKVSAESKEENGVKSDVANLDRSTCGHFGHMSKDQKITQKITSLSSSSQKQTNEKELLIEMISIWNQKIGQDSSNLSFTYWRQRTLRKTLKQSFQNDLTAWTHYCTIIAHNSFLMGDGPNGWKVSLDWALKPQNIQKVQEKRYTGQKDIPQQAPIFSKHTLQGSEIWKSMADLLAERLGTFVFYSWFKEGCLKDETSQYPTLSLGTNFKADWVERHFGPEINAAAKEVMPQMNFLRLVA